MSKRKEEEEMKQYYFALPTYLEDMLRHLKRQEYRLANMTDAEALEYVLQKRITDNEEYMKYQPDPDDERDTRNEQAAEDRY